MASEHQSVDELKRLLARAESDLWSAQRTLAQVAHRRCAWTETDGLWLTGCDNAFTLEHGTPRDNGMAYCCYCGGELVQRPTRTLARPKPQVG